MTDSELITEFMRTVESMDGVHLQVGVVEWHEPHSPSLTWKVFRKWRKLPDSSRLAAAQQTALMSSRFFRVCRRCGERNNVGHMHDRTVCQTCAEDRLGVVY